MKKMKNKNLRGMGIMRNENKKKQRGMEMKNTVTEMKKNNRN